jgi:hypothetical protein
VCSRGEHPADKPRIVGDGVDEDSIAFGKELSDGLRGIRPVIQSQVEDDDIASGFLQYPLQIRSRTGLSDHPKTSGGRQAPEAAGQSYPNRHMVVHDDDADRV